MKPMMIAAVLCFAQGCIARTNLERGFTPEETNQLLMAMGRMCRALPDSCGQIDVDDFVAVNGEHFNQWGGDLLGRHNRLSGKISLFVDNIQRNDRRIQDVAIHEMFHKLGRVGHCQEKGAMLTKTFLPDNDHWITKTDLTFACSSGRVSCDGIAPEIRTVEGAL